MPRQETAAARGTVDEAEVARFSALADTWWDPAGKMGVLHKFNPVRLAFIRDTVAAHWGRDPADGETLKGLRLLDIGCGGGLLCEPMARLGAEVVGADASQTNIEVARIHRDRMGLSVDYRATTAEALAEAGESFDVVLNMEVVEHVADVPLFLSACASMVRPGGLMFVATLNRTLKAFALAIVGAEYVLGWLPRGTHSWDRFVRPEELESGLAEAGMRLLDETGVVFNPLRDEWLRSRDMDVNYMIVAEKPRG
ncbi:MAG: bifunctional 2-polyprenyl-6-hydroxyphenol methylase/3-demethylubiquinol 3-O-methyltransferase UbiG [Flavobacteriaceae bacterium]